MTDKHPSQEPADITQTEENLKRLASIVASSDDAIISKTLDGIILTWNKGAEKIYGYRADEVIGKSISIVVPPDRVDEHAEILTKIKNGEPVDHYLTVHQKKNGSLLNISLTISPIRNKSGTIIGASSIARDFTREKYAEEALRESEERFRSLIDNALTGISIVQDDRVVFQNREQERLFGPLPRPSRLSDLEGLHPKDREKVRNFHLDITSGKVSTRETTFKFYPKGEHGNAAKPLWVHCRAASIKYSGKQAIVVNMMDITRFKELENILMVQDKMASLGRVATGIAHEIRNPLSGINIYLNTLEKIYDREQDHDKVTRIIKQLQSASNKIESVIKRVMDFSRPGPLQLVLTDINRPIEEAIALSAVSLRKRQITMQTVLAENLPQVCIDPQLIEEVVLNLINNAAEAMKDNTRGKFLEISSALEANAMLISVCDSGPGVPLSLRDSIFDPFFTTKNGGTGIGLSLSYRIIKDHGGSLHIDESILGGAKFTIQLPLATAEKYHG